MEEEKYNKKKCLDHLADDVPVNTGQREKKTYTSKFGFGRH